MLDTKSKKATKELIYKHLQEGMFKKDAANLAGIDESSFYRWIKADASFASRVQISILKYKRNLIQAVNHGAVKNGSLERCHKKVTVLERSRW